MIRILSMTLIVLTLAGPASAQQIGTLPGVHRVPADLVESLQILEGQQLDSLKQFTAYLEQRSKAKAVPSGLYWNAKAIYVEAQVHAETDPQAKRERLEELTEIYKERVALDAASPNRTWFGVNRVKLGELTRQEFETFRREAASVRVAPPRDPSPP